MLKIKAWCLGGKGEVFGMVFEVHILSCNCLGIVGRYFDKN